jgi:hypothetical protein
MAGMGWGVHKGVLVGLGFTDERGWELQTERYYWKVDLINERTKELSESVTELPKDATASNPMYD